MKEAPTTEIFLYRHTMPSKHCKWFGCNSDSRYLHKEHMRGVVFCPFPKPCKDYRLLRRDPSLVAIQHEPANCPQCSKCLAWIMACHRSGFQRLEQINSCCYLCSRHFAPGKVPVNAKVKPFPSPLHSSEEETTLPIGVSAFYMRFFFDCYTHLVFLTTEIKIHTFF